jgi:hypothetical protein
MFMVMLWLVQIAFYIGDCVYLYTQIENCFPEERLYIIGGKNGLTIMVALGWCVMSWLLCHACY